MNECRDTENIHFEGHQDLVEKFYRISHIYIQTSVYESFGISAVGAMAHKIPCIVGSAGGLVEIFQEEKCGIIISSDNEEDYVNRILELIHDNSKRQYYGQKGFEVYTKNYMKINWEQKMDNLLLSIKN